MTMEHLENARERVMMGPELKGLMSIESKKTTAYHESGHAIVALFTKVKYLNF